MLQGLITYEYNVTGTSPNFVYQSRQSTVNSTPDGLTFKAATYWNNTDGSVAEAFDRRIYAVADRNNFTGLSVNAIDTSNPSNGTLDAVVGLSGGQTVPANARRNMIFMLDPNSGDVINRYNGQDRNGLPANLAAASPQNYFAEDISGGGLNATTSMPTYVPWSGTTNVGQVFVQTTGEVTSVVASESFVYAFTSLGEIFRYSVDNDETRLPLGTLRPIQPIQSELRA